MGMGVVNMRELARNTVWVVDAVDLSGKVVWITRRARPVEAVIPLDDATFAVRLSSYG